MKGGKIPDDFFKDKIDYCGLEDSIYNQLSRTMARNVDIDFAKTPVIDILTGYTRYTEAEKRAEQLEERCEYLERSNNRREDEIIELRDENVDLVSKNKQLENIIKEAVDSIKEYKSNNYSVFSENEIEIDLINNLLNILNKGSEDK